MTMTIKDEVILALTIWRENRGGGTDGMQSVANVILNTAARRKTSVWSECIRPLRFSSITAKGDPELALWPAENDMQFKTALELADMANTGELQDITRGATLYYAPHNYHAKQTFKLPDTGEVIPFPDGWDETKVQYLCTIAYQVFFKEL
jgi:hypothetical protein